jgi:peptide/nickel transport system permease protein
VLVLGSLLVAFANAAVDLAYLRLDPRIKAR